jgi:hypothetical protein
MRTSDFLGAYEYVGPTGSRSEEQADLEAQREDNLKAQEKLGGKTI